MKILVLLALLFFPINAQESMPDVLDKPWGWHTIIDLEDCDPATISSKGHIQDYIKFLCNLIDMKRFGEPIVVRFGKDKKIEGYSMVQLIETSCITGHFSEYTNSAYIDIFSCKEYDTEAAAEFTACCFKAKIKKKRLILRR